MRKKEREKSLKRTHLTECKPTAPFNAGTIDLQNPTFIAIFQLGRDGEGGERERESLSWGV